jgi:hypothetical protein
MFDKNYFAKIQHLPKEKSGFVFAISIILKGFGNKNKFNYGSP